jgi:hypothetical protein
MSKRIKHFYDAVTGRSETVIWDKGKKYKGIAITHEEDKDVMTQYTGLTISTGRAEIKRSEGKAKDCGKEIKRLQKQIIHLTELQLKHKTDARIMSDALEQYIENKGIFAKKLRKLRNNQAVEATMVVKGDE